MISSLDIDEEVTLVNCNGQPMANGYTCPERTTLHGRPIIDKCVVYEITGVMPNGVALFKDPIERDHSLYPMYSGQKHTFIQRSVKLILNSLDLF